MRYLSLLTVSTACKGCVDKTTNQFWGLISILCTIKSNIEPAVSYNFIGGDVSRLLDNLFSFGAKNNSDSGRTWTVIFSNVWKKYMLENCIKNNPNIYDTAIWFFRKEGFVNDVTIEKLLSLFLERIHLKKEDLISFFDFSPRELVFDDYLYNDESLREYLSENFNVIFESNKKTLTFERKTEENKIEKTKKAIWTCIQSPAGNLSAAPFVQTLYSGQGIQKCIILTQFDFNSLYKKQKKDPNYNMHNYQIIFYGAPGTGKSHKIDEDTEGSNVIRTTFHPDSDYSTFVGAYKPWMNGTNIVYKFIKQAFLKAYLLAWKKYSEGVDTIEPQFLVIEEINRGNCAQIFGDLFQLLDRTSDGFSTYPIEADSDIQDAIKEAFKDESEYKLSEDFDIEGVIEKYTSNYNKTLTEDVKEGRVLLLPKNLYIWATMNTSDQSLFPIDSAFKRRWEWKYIPIANHADKNWHIKFEYKVEGEMAVEEASGIANGVKTVDKTWWEFVDGINKHIYKATHSEDKKLGFFFCKPSKKENPDNADEEPTIITPETFVSKVVFYLWQDVFKISGAKKGVFKDLTFDMFYLKTGEATEENPDKINYKVLDEFITRAIKDPE